MKVIASPARPLSNGNSDRPGTGRWATSPLAGQRLLTTAFAEGPARQRALGVWASVLGAGLVAGVVAGGLLTSFIGWRAVFFVNVPLAAAAAVAAPAVVREGSARSGPARVDALGGVLVTVAVVALVYALAVPATGAPLQPACHRSRLRCRRCRRL
jgi:MFS family permease